MRTEKEKQVVEAWLKIVVGSDCDDRLSLLDRKEMAIKALNSFDGFSFKGDLGYVVDVLRKNEHKVRELILAY